MFTVRRALEWVFFLMVILSSLLMGYSQDNWQLAAARGLSLLELLSNQYGIDEARLSVESFGSQAPRDSNETAEGRAMNRRVEILILN